jgi:hypothetical protein
MDNERECQQRAEREKIVFKLFSLLLLLLRRAATAV